MKDYTLGEVLVEAASLSCQSQRERRKGVKGYKAFNENLACRDFKYEVGKAYELDGKLLICKNGFHFCKTIADCYNYYPMNDETRICEVEALGDIVSNGDKYATDKIRIVRELSKGEINCGNEGYDNQGWHNKGDYNKGNSNKGNYNEGDSNEGDCNKGNSNKGNFNKGDCNEGNSNKGDYNEGDCNEGDCNIGIRNKGDYQVGVCNTNAPLVIFNKVSKMTLKELIESGAYSDIVTGQLTDKVRAIDTFDQKVWDEIFKKGEQE